MVTGYPYKFDNPIAGKTGTTQNQSDGWFIGMVPNLSTGVWVGAPRTAPSTFVDHHPGPGSLDGPADLDPFHEKELRRQRSLGISKEEFERPEELTINVDCDKEVDPEEDQLDSETRPE